MTVISRRRLLATGGALSGSLVLQAACTAPSGSQSSRTAPAATPPPSARMQFMAGYKPQANLPFVGAYVAQSRGYFAQQGLTVDITHSSGQGEHLKLLLQGTVHVTTASTDAVLARRAEDLPVVSFAVLGQRNDRAYAALASSDIRGVKDWEGKTVGYKVNPTPDYLAMLAANGVDRTRIQEVPVGFDPRLLAAGKVDVYPVFESNEPDLLARQGVQIRLFRPNDYGFPGLGLNYLTRQELVETDRGLLERFLKATLRGIADAKASPEQATDIVMQFAPNEDRAHQLAMLNIELQMAESPGTRANGIGWASSDQWQAVHDSLLQFGGLPRGIDVSSAYTDRIVRSVHRGGELVWP